MLVVTNRVVVPIRVQNRFVPIRFGVVAMIVVEMGVIPPPTGRNMFVGKGIAPDLPITTIFAGVLPGLRAMLVCLLLIVLLAQIALFLPTSMFGCKTVAPQSGWPRPTPQRRLDQSPPRQRKAGVNRDQCCQRSKTRHRLPDDPEELSGVTKTQDGTQLA